MKPVNLLPSDVAVVSANAGKPNLGMIGGAAAGFLAIIVVGVYFGMARVETVKSETAAATARTEDMTAQTTSVQSQVQTLGTPAVDSDKQLAQGAETVFVAAYTERHDFVLLAQELRAIMENTGGWYVHVEATSATGPTTDGKAVTIEAVFPTKELAASFNERVNATLSLKHAETIAEESTRLSDLDTRRAGIYFAITVEADLEDRVAPFADGGSSTADGTGTTVGEGGGSGTMTLSLDPEPKPKPTAPAKPEKPKNPFDLAATMAGGGGTK